MGPSQGNLRPSYQALTSQFSKCSWAAATTLPQHRVVVVALIQVVGAVLLIVHKPTSTARDIIEGNFKVEDHITHKQHQGACLHTAVVLIAHQPTRTARDIVGDEMVGYTPPSEGPLPSAEHPGGGPDGPQASPRGMPPHRRAPHSPQAHMHSEGHPRGKHGRLYPAIRGAAVTSGCTRYMPVPQWVPWPLARPAAGPPAMLAPWVPRGSRPARGAQPTTFSLRPPRPAASVRGPRRTPGRPGEGDCWTNLRTASSIYM